MLDISWSRREVKRTIFRERKLGRTVAKVVSEVFPFGYEVAIRLEKDGMDSQERKDRNGGAGRFEREATNQADPGSAVTTDICATMRSSTAAFLTRICIQKNSIATAQHPIKPEMSHF